MATARARYPYPKRVEDESVYNMIPERVSETQQSLRHTSKFAGHARRTTADSKRGVGAGAGAATMGFETSRPDPKHYMRRGRGEEIKATAKPTPTKTPREHIRPPVPKREERPMAVATQERDFVRDNALEAIRTQANKTEQQSRMYTQKKDFGRTPSYLARRREGERQRAQQTEREMETRRAQETAAFVMPDHERLELLNGLKTNWERLNMQYQRLSLSIDNVQKKQRKERLEAELKQIEADIATLDGLGGRRTVLVANY